MTNRLMALLTAVGLASTSYAFAATLTVPGDYPTIQAALNASTSGDVVLVAPGTYFENLTIGLAQDGVRLESMAGASSTTIDGGGVDKVIRVVGGVSAATEIYGFTIRNGYTLEAGAGLYIEASSPKITQCVIEGNIAQAGGGVYSIFASPTFAWCTIRNNHAPWGSGGGVYADYVGQTTLSYCLVYGNDCAAYGGGVTAWENAVVVLDHTTVASNGAALLGGNLFFTRGGAFNVTSSIIAFPSSNSNVHADNSPGTSSFYCSDLYVAGGINTAGFPSPIGGGKNFSLDPDFCDLGSGQFGLTIKSPCASSTNTLGCKQVGARDVECGVVSTEKRSWGGLKSSYR